MEHYTTNTTIGLIYMCALLMGTCSCIPHVSRFTSHVRIATPTVSFSHGVGDPITSYGPLLNRLQHPTGTWNSAPLKRPHHHESYPVFQDYHHHHHHQPSYPEVYHEDEGFQGYPRYRPSIPFHESGLTQGNSIVQQPQIHFTNNHHLNGHNDLYTLPVLPPSPYKVDSADPESTWPEGLVLTPQIPIRYGFDEKNDHADHTGYHHGGYETNSIVDPHYLDGIDAVKAVEHLNAHGELFHHEIPHVRAILANQQLRAANGLKPFRLGSINVVSPWFRQ